MGTVAGCVNPPILSSMLHQAHLFGLREARSCLRTGNTAAHRDVVQAHPLSGPARRRHGIKHFLQNPTDRSLIRVHRRLVVGRVPAGTAVDLYGPARANPCLDAYVGVRQNREALNRARRVIEADMINALEQAEVREEIAQYAISIADSQDELASRQSATHEAAHQLKHVLDFSKTLRQEVATANLGNLINQKPAAYSEPSVFASRHRGIAKAITEGSEVNV